MLGTHEFDLSFQLNLKLHLKTHNKSHVCPVCGHAYAQLSFLNKHILKHQDENDNNIEDDKDEAFKDDDMNDDSYKCDWEGCLFRSKYRNVLKRHIDAQHQGAECPSVMTVKTTVSRELDDQRVQMTAYLHKEKCPTCGKLFEERFQLRNHMFDKHDQVLQVESEIEDCGIGDEQNMV